MNDADAHVERKRISDQRKLFWLRVLGMAAICMLMAAFLPAASAAGADKRPADGLCEWRSPGANKYMLPLEAAVDRLAYIPAETRAALKQRLNDPRKHLNADDHIMMTSEAVVGESGEWVVRDMNGGSGEVCWGEVTRASWAPGHAERALVFCDSGWCVAYFSVCRNVASAALVKPRPPAPESPGGAPQDKGLRAKMPHGIEFTWEQAAELPLVPVRVASPDKPGRDEERLSEALLWPDWSVPYRAFTTRGVSAVGPEDQWVSAPSHVTPIPEPGTWAMLSLGLFCIAAARLLNKRSAR